MGMRAIIDALKANGTYGVAQCLFITIAFVGGLYIWPPSPHPRDSPHTIKRRFLSLAMTLAMCWVPTYVCIRDEHSRRSRAANLAGTFHVLGLGRPDADAIDAVVDAVLSVACVMYLTAALFLGPLTHLALDGKLVSTFADAFRIDTVLKLRNYVVAPVSEEFAFRACMAPLLILCGRWSAPAARTFTPMRATWTCPVFFGLAHLHHFGEACARFGVLVAVVSVVAQFTYTVVFGWFAAFTLLRTGSIAGAMASHAFCNVVGFPDVEGAVAHERKAVVLAAYACGIALFTAGLWRVTDPDLHHASLWEEWSAL
jgi:prenyl protein peptidase